MPRLPFAVQAYRHRSLPVSAQRLINWFPEAQPQDAKARVVLLPTPGVVRFVALPVGPIRGMRGMADRLYVVAGINVYRVRADASFELAGSIDDGGPVSMAGNGTQMVIVVPETRKAWVATTTALTQITHADFGSPIAVDVIDGYAAFVEADSTQFFLSAINDALTYDALDFASAESSPDNLVTVRRVGRELWLFGERSTEVWNNVGGAAGFPFLRISGGAFDRGCAAAFSVATGGNTVFWVGDDRVIYASENYAGRRISTHPIEQALAGYSIVNDARGWFYEQEGHQFYAVTFPDAGETWTYDRSTGAWHERESEGYGTWRCATGEAFASGVIAGDSRTGDLLRVDTIIYDELGAEIRRQATGAPLHAEGRLIRFAALEADMETGTGLPVGQGAQPKAWLQFSDDGGRTWSNEFWTDLGPQGNYLARARWHQLGAARNRVFRLGMSDPVRTALLAANIDMEPGSA